MTTIYIAFMFALPFLECVRHAGLRWCWGYRVLAHARLSRISLSTRQLDIGYGKVAFTTQIKLPVWIALAIARRGQHDFDIDSYHGDDTPPQRIEGVSDYGVKYSFIIASDMGYMRCRFCRKEYGQTGGCMYLSFEHFDIDYPCVGLSK